METAAHTVNDTRTDLREPGLYAVVMHNDDITAMDFVVRVLVSVFDKSPAEASVIMMAIHEGGSGVAGVYTYDMALSKKGQADRLSAEAGYPLRLEVTESL